MARIKGGLNAKKKHRRILKLAKGYMGARFKQYRIAKQSVKRALAESYKGRKQRKRDFRKLWIVRIRQLLQESMVFHTAILCTVLRLQVSTLTERFFQRWLLTMQLVSLRLLRQLRQLLQSNLNKII